MKRSASLLTAAAIASMLVSGCAGSVPDAPAAEPAAGNPPKIATPDMSIADGNTELDDDITIVMANDMTNWDPSGQSSTANSYIVDNVYSKLFAYDEYLRGVPDLCRSYEMVSDIEWRFTVHEGVKFHDGSELTADDVVYSLERAKENATILRPLDEISRVDK